MSSTFDLAKFLEKSRALDLSGIDWSTAKTQPISDAELRCIKFMVDVEAYTIAYLRDLLNTHAIYDQEVAEFLPCWAYEESFHSRAFERFLAAAGMELNPNRLRSYQRPTRLWERFKDFGAGIISRLTEDFVTVYLTWGSIQELTTMNAYKALARKSRNDAMIEIARRIMRDEARHFSFYFNKAKERLTSSSKAQWLTSAMLKRFWIPVGAGLHSAEDAAFVTAYLFGDQLGMEAAHEIDQTITRLPGLSWFNLFENFAKKSCESLIEQAPWRELVETNS